MSDGTEPQYRMGEHVPCKCGCGRMFMKVRQERNRKYSPECPKGIAMAKIMATKRSQEQARREGNMMRCIQPMKPKQFICLECYNLPHVRPDSGCARCGLPHGEAP